MEGLEATMRAIDSLSRGNDTIKANDFLMTFETTAEAWGVALQLLQIPSSSQGTNYRFFGAKIFYSKVQKDLSQLKPEDVNSLKEMLVNNISSFAIQKPLDMTVIRYLCLALSALALQLNQHGIVNQILTWLNPIINTSPTVLLELLTVLPEECFNRQILVEYTVREQFSQQLCDSATQVFLFLDTLQISSSINTTKQILKSFDRWIGNTNIPSTELLNSSLFHKSLQACSNIELLEDAVEVLITASHKYECRDIHLCECILSHIISLRPIWNAQMSHLTKSSEPEEWDIIRALTRLFTDATEAFLDLLVSTQLSRNIQVEIFQQLLECTKFPYAHEIARIPLKLFYDLSLFICHSEDTVNLGETFAPYFTSLTSIAASHMLLPAAILDGRQEISEELKLDRVDWREAIGDCKEVIGNQSCLKLLCTIIQEQIASSSSSASPCRWDIIEACLSGMIFVGPALPSEETILMSQLIGFIISLPDILVLKITAIELLGRVSKWIVYNPNYLGVVLSNLTDSLSQPAFSSCASESIMQIFKACPAALVHELPIGELHTLIVQLREQNALPLVSDLHLLEGICSVISEFDQQKCGVHLLGIVTPIATQLTSQLSAPNAEQLHAVIGNIDRLTTVMRHVRVKYISGDHPSMQIFLQLEPLCHIALQYYTSEYVCEKICRFYKYSMRSIGKVFAQYLPTMCHHLLTAFQSKSFSPLIYAASICVTEFGSSQNGIYDDLLLTMLWGFSDEFFKKFLSLQDLMNAPDVVEEYFHFLAKYLEFCPNRLIANAQISILIQAGLMGLQLDHRDATKGILHFFERLIATSGVVSKDTVKLVDEIVHSFAAQLTLILFRSLLGEMPAYVLHENSGSLCDVIWKLKLYQSSHLPGWIAQSLEHFSAEVQEEARKLWLPNVVLNFSKPRQLADHLDEFHLRCKRRVAKNSSCLV